ncbi:hypothetical protein EVG20_g7517 [Dentipellis fragilis]|uniref:NADP-dependent oxidoreductase domain-containing protein n=1 Tax=Dentipellis fragilis TaxID=205917 RepID=A0A4Y9YCC4_9AGAM|nr:hypothetical protein EVG20_g7517 [Dentipellis fragilis]
MSKFPTRKIGDTDVTAIGYGAMGIAAYYGPPMPGVQMTVLGQASERQSTADCPPFGAPQNYEVGIEGPSNEFQRQYTMGS